MPSDRELRRRTKRQERKKLENEHAQGKIAIKDRDKLIKTEVVLYKKFYKIMISILNVDREYFNGERLKKNKGATNKNFSISKGECYIADTLCRDKARVITLNRVEKSVLGKDVDDSKGAPIKIFFKDFFDKKDNVSSVVRKMLSVISGLEPLKIMKEITKIMHVCRVANETMKMGIEIHYNEDPKLKAKLLKRYDEIQNELDILMSNDYTNLIKKFPTEAHLTEEGKKSKKGAFFSQETKDSERIVFSREKTMSRSDLRMTKLKKVMKNIRSTAGKKVSSTTAIRLVATFNESYEKGKKKSETYFKTIMGMAKKEKKEELEQLLQEYQDPNNGNKENYFYANILMRINELKPILDTDLERVEKKETELSRFIKTKEELEKECEGKSEKEIVEYCDELISKIRYCEQELDELYRRFIRDLGKGDKLLEELSNWNEKKVYKKWFNEIIKKCLRGIARRARLKHKVKKAEKAEAKTGTETGTGTNNTSPTEPIPAPVSSEAGSVPPASSGGEGDAPNAGEGEKEPHLAPTVEVQN